MFMVKCANVWPEFDVRTLTGYVKQRNKKVKTKQRMRTNKINENFSSFHRMALSSAVFRWNWNLGMLVFVEGGKTVYPEKNFSE